MAANGATTDGESSSGIQERTIKVGIGLNEDHPEGQGIIKFKELVEQKSGGKMKVQNFFSASLGDDQKMTEALQAGLQEITIPSTSPLVGMVEEFGLFDLPFVFSTEEEAYAVLDGPVGQKILEKLPEHGLIGLGYWENGFRNLTNSSRPVRTLEDFQGLKIRTMQTEVHLEAFKALGTNPTPMAFSEVFSALENKTVDGQENPLATIKSNKFYEVQDYLSLTKHVYTPFVFLVSKSFWDGLSPEEQTILREAAVEAGQYQRDLNRQENEKARADLKAAGMNVNEISDQDRQKIKQAVQPVVDRFAKEIGQELYQEMQSELEKVK
ncbi:TRAP transporter substrate-binding protein [Brevibacillus humidisoli]|nr:TRAP transporter substrate-binding protein [Brevibacillus humidisoli]UFJ43416.1 TRAP transporter substrate-binding protein [Brevibacillus humidisoli]